MKTFFLYPLVVSLIITSACFRRAPDTFNGPYLYYKLKSLNVELLGGDSTSKQDVILGDFKKDKDLFVRITFELKPNKRLDRGKFPGDKFSKCSKESITSFEIGLREHQDYTALNSVVK